MGYSKQYHCNIGEYTEVGGSYLCQYLPYHDHDFDGLKWYAPFHTRQDSKPCTFLLPENKVGDKGRQDNHCQNGNCDKKYKAAGIVGTGGALKARASDVTIGANGAVCTSASWRASEMVMSGCVIQQHGPCMHQTVNYRKSGGNLVKCAFVLVSRQTFLEPRCSARGDASFSRGFQEENSPSSTNVAVDLFSENDGGKCFSNTS